MYDNIKYFYDRLGWSKEKVHDAVGMGWITEEEYRSIVNMEGG
ncbi:XkdX family protein [Fructobacillus fructosus]